MPLRHRDRNSIFQAVFPIKTLAHKLSVFLIIGLAIILIVFSRIDSGFSSLVRTRVNDTTITIIDIFSRPMNVMIYIRNTFYNYFNVYNQNQYLKSENERLKNLQSLSGHLVVENNYLRKYLSFVPEPGVSFITARIAGETGGLI